MTGGGECIAHRRGNKSRNSEGLLPRRDVILLCAHHIERGVDAPEINGTAGEFQRVWFNQAIFELEFAQIKTVHGLR